MTPVLLIAAIATIGALHFWFFHRKRIYRVKTLNRKELNRMHRYTAFSVLLCLAMLFAGVWIPGARMPLVASAAFMLLLILPLRTVMIEMGVRYRRTKVCRPALNPSAPRDGG